MGIGAKRLLPQIKAVADPSDPGDWPPGEQTIRCLRNVKQHTRNRDVQNWVYDKEHQQRPTGTLRGKEGYECHPGRHCDGGVATHFWKPWAEDCQEAADGEIVSVRGKCHEPNPHL